MNGMNRVFFGTLISHAESHIKEVKPLLARASNRFLTEKSIDEAIEHLRKSTEHLINAKQSYINHLPPSRVQSEAWVDPRIQHRLS